MILSICWLLEVDVKHAAIVEGTPATEIRVLADAEGLMISGSDVATLQFTEIIRKLEIRVFVGVFLL